MEAIAIVKEIVSYFKQSQPALEQLLAQQQALDVRAKSVQISFVFSLRFFFPSQVPQHRLIQSVPTRWDTDFSAVARLDEQWDAVTAALGVLANAAGRTAAQKEGAQRHLAHLTPALRLFLKRLQPLLEPIAQITSTLQTVTYPSISTAFVCLVDLHRTLCNDSWNLLLATVRQRAVVDAAAAAADAAAMQLDQAPVAGDATLRDINLVHCALLRSLEERYGFARDADGHQVLSRAPVLFIAGVCSDPRYHSLNWLRDQPLAVIELKRQFHLLMDRLTPSPAADEEVLDAGAAVVAPDSELFTLEELQQLQQRGPGAVNRERQFRLAARVARLAAASAAQRGLSSQQEAAEFSKELGACCSCVCLVLTVSN